MKHQKFFPALLQGALIGLGAVLPGISGGVLSVIFGIYRPVMELLADPLKNFRTHFPKLSPRLSWRCQCSCLLLKPVSRSFCMPFHRSDYRNAALTLGRSRKRGTFQKILSFLFLRGCLYFRTANWSTALCYCHSPRF